MSGRYLGKFLQRQCKIELPRDNLGKQNVLEKAFFRFLKSLQSKILAPVVPPMRLGLLQTSCFELLGGWNVRYKYISLKAASKPESIIQPVQYY